MGVKIVNWLGLDEDDDEDAFQSRKCLSFEEEGDVSAFAAYEGSS